MVVPEQKARTTYDNLLRLIDDPDVREPLKFLRAREIVHFQRFGDVLAVVQAAFDVRPREGQPAAKPDTAAPGLTAAAR